VILLDTHALIWLIQAHRRARPLRKLPRLQVSPATILELQFLAEAGRVRLAAGRTLADLTADPRWTVDEPPASRWFALACELSWTRDPFDRLIAAHAKTRRWTLATGDEHLLAQLPPSDVLAL
jgi:PIN domain nuclease of toxin-antitoxin system